ncbi:MAG: tetratricopeptide repeat protein [Myxococcales bacterium]|nr:tetratricopeptide repeat protein [Myxococcales bacterium]
MLACPGVWYWPHGVASTDLERQLVFAEVHAGLFGSARPVDVGRYIITGRLGHGGMGVVYRAYDPQLDRRVALKVLHPHEAGRADSSHRERLLREARALGRLAHPNVVAVHDVGTVGEQVYVAMELVEGPPLDRWLAAEPRSTTEILRVFAAAGRGLLAVHEAGLVHRDFKPSNVIVGDDGRVRVVDFGLAKPVLDATPSCDAERGPTPGSPSPGDGALTRRGAVVGTPLYMAPEQARGVPGDARTDQYAFCVVLHEALHGRRPGAVQPSPARTTRRVPMRVQRALSRGLSTRPEDRFAGMGPLVAILERPPPARAWLVGGVATATLLGAWALTGEPPDPCVDSAAAMDGIWSDEARSGLASRLASPLPHLQGTWDRIEQRLDARADAWRAMAHDNCEASRARGEQSETTRSRRAACLDGRLDETAAMLEVLGSTEPERLSQALLALDGLPPVSRCAAGAQLALGVPTSEVDPQAAREIRYRESRLRVQLQVAMDGQGALEQAQALVADAEALGDGPLVAETKHRLARVHAWSGDYEAAATTLREAIAVAMEHRHEEIEAQARTELARVLMVRGELAAAREARVGALAAARRWGQPRALAIALRTSAMVQQADEHLDEARADYERALAVAQRIDGGALVVVQTRTALGTLLAQRGELEAAAEQFERALAGSIAELGPDHPRITPALTSLAAAHHELGQLSRAREEYERALRLQRSVLPPGHPDLARTMTSSAETALALGDLEHASTLASEALEIFEQRLGPEHPDVAWASEILALVRRAEGDGPGEAAAWTKVVGVREVRLPAGHPELAEGWLALAAARLRAGASAEARAAAERARAVATDGGHDPLRARAEAMLADMQPSTEAQG